MLTLEYPLEPDENLVMDGRDLARQLVAQAFRLLVPYTNACPACTDALFTVLANGVIEQMHQEGLPGQIMGLGTDEQTTAHFAAAKDSTAALLEKADLAVHSHH